MHCQVKCFLSSNGDNMHRLEQTPLPLVVMFQDDSGRTSVKAGLGRKVFILDNIEIKPLTLAY